MSQKKVQAAFADVLSLDGNAFSLHASQLIPQPGLLPVHHPPTLKWLPQNTLVLLRAP